MNTKRSFKCAILFMLSSISFCYSLGALAIGGYLTFIPPDNIPSKLNELNFYFRMVSNPGPKSFMYYAHNFAINSLDKSQEQLTGYIGPQNNSGNNNSRRNLAIATVWFGKENRLLSFTPGTEAFCQKEHGGAESQSGWLIQCRTLDSNEFARNDMTNGTTYKIILKESPSSSFSRANIYEFSIKNTITGKVTLLGSMTFSNTDGFNPKWPSNFLENFGGGYTCDTLPYLAYSEDAPIGIKDNIKYKYTVHENIQGIFDCPHRVAFTNDHSTAIVEFAIKN